MRLGSTLTLFRPEGRLLGAPPSTLKKLNNFKTVKTITTKLSDFS